MALDLTNNHVLMYIN